MPHWPQQLGRDCDCMTKRAVTLGSAVLGSVSLIINKLILGNKQRTHDV